MEPESIDWFGDVVLTPVDHCSWDVLQQTCGQPGLQHCTYWSSYSRWFNPSTLSSVRESHGEGLDALGLSACEVKGLTHIVWSCGLLDLDEDIGIERPAVGDALAWVG